VPQSKTRWLADLIAASDVPVQKIPAGKRALAAKHKGKRGRPAKDGERYACGKLKPTPSAEISPAHWQRIKTQAARFGEDARLSSELSRLSLLGHLTTVQTAAGFRMAELYGQYDKTFGMRRTARSVAYDVGRGDHELAEERKTEAQRKAEIERTRNIRTKFKKLQQAMAECGPTATPMLEQLCIEDAPLLQGDIARTADWLDHIARHFGEKWKRRKPGPGRPDRARDAQAAADAAKRPKPETAAETAFRTVLAKLRPDLNADEIARAYRIQAVLADRERFRRDKPFRKSADTAAPSMAKAAKKLAGPGS
jgi:hypothetical protein